MLDVAVHAKINDPEPDEYEVDFVSLVSSGTYGPPAIVAPSKAEPKPLGRPGQRVLYINTAFVPMFEITRRD